MVESLADACTSYLHRVLQCYGEFESLRTDLAGLDYRAGHFLCAALTEAIKKSRGPLISSEFEKSAVDFEYPLELLLPDED